MKSKPSGDQTDQPTAPHHPAHHRRRQSLKFNTGIAALMECLNSLSAHHQARDVSASPRKTVRNILA